MLKLQLTLKRLIDFVGGAVLLALSLLALIVAAMVVFCYYPHWNPLFFQERVGRHERRFKIVKLRTLPAGHHIDRSHEITVPGPIRWIRRHSLDELPNFWNVVVGHLSLIGPKLYAWGRSSFKKRKARSSVGEWVVGCGHGEGEEGWNLQVFDLFDLHPLRGPRVVLRLTRRLVP